MTETTLERVTEQAKALTPDQDRERRFAEHLLKIGMLDHIPEGYPPGYLAPLPITLIGEPLSETILRERR